MPSTPSPDGSLVLEVWTDSVADGGTGGHGHDADDYFTHTLHAVVYDAVTRGRVAGKSWSESVDAGRGSSVGERPREVAWRGAQVVARFDDGREEIVL
jgi:hypothetical protein